MKIRVSGEPAEVRDIISQLPLLKDFETIHISKEYAQTRRYRGEVSVYIDLIKKENT